MAITRKSVRTALDADVLLRRAGQGPYRTQIYDISAHGCKVAFVARPELDETLWVKLDGLEAVQATVCWVEGHVVGVEYDRPMHPAVLDLLLSRLKTA